MGLGHAAGCGGQSVGDAYVPEETTVGGRGGATGGVGGTTGGVGGAGAAPPVAEGPLGCTNPTFPFGEEAGYVQCQEGFLHRSEPGRCAQTPLRAGEPTAAVAPACGTDADCTYLENGRCLSSGLFGSSGCVSSCEMDADCEPGSACLCGAVANVCVPATCESDADCGGNLLCASYWVSVSICTSSQGFACQLPDDDCTVSCPVGYRCHVDTAAEPITRDCVAQAGSGGTCGRPFLVAGSERLAPATFRDEWRDVTAPGPELARLTATERLALTAHWQAVALMEHASIAAFARFALELLALGAPALLIADATSAMQDEQRHATACFTIASAFAGVPLGPGPLPVRGCLADVDLESVTVTTFLEGCIGETIAAVEARELALTTEDPVLRETLAGIAEDEARHALLAWSFLKWALEQGGPALAARVHDAWRAETTRRLEQAPSGASLAPERELVLGLPSAEFRRSTRRRVLHEIVKPCLDGLRRNADANVESQDAA
jgi:hypothetical protein